MKLKGASSAIGMFKRLSPKKKETVESKPIEQRTDTGSAIGNWKWKKKEAVMVLKMIEFLDSKCLGIEGLYRKQGESVEQKEFYAAFKNGKLSEMSSLNPHTISTSLKKILRDLMRPLIVYKAFDTLLESFVKQDQEYTVESMMPFVNKALSMSPALNKYILNRLLTHLLRVAKSPATKMSIETLGGTIGVILVRKSESQDDRDYKSIARRKIIATLVIEGSEIWDFGEISTLDEACEASVGMDTSVDHAQARGTFFRMKNAVSTQGNNAGQSSSAKLLPPITNEAAELLLHTVAYLGDNALQEKGIYRRLGDTVEQRELVKLYKEGTKPDFKKITSYHSIASALKQVLRDAYEPLLCYRGYSLMLASLESEDELKASIETTISTLPLPNRRLLQELLLHLNAAALCPENEMDIEALGGSIGINLIRRGESSDDQDYRSIRCRRIFAKMLILNATSWPYNCDRAIIQAKGKRARKRNSLVVRVAPKAENPKLPNMSSEVAYYIGTMFDYVSSSTNDLEGIFKMQGPASETKELLPLIKQREMPELSLYNKKSVATVIKQLLRDTYAPLMTYGAYQIMAISVGGNRQQFIKTANSCIQALPECNRQLLRTVLTSLSRIAESQADSSVEMLASVVGIALTRGSESDSDRSFEAIQIQKKISIILIEECESWNYAVARRSNEPLLPSASNGNRSPTSIKKADPHTAEAGRILSKLDKEYSIKDFDIKVDTALDQDTNIISAKPKPKSTLSKNIRRASTIAMSHLSYKPDSPSAISVPEVRLPQIPERTAGLLSDCVKFLTDNIPNDGNTIAESEGLYHNPGVDYEVHDLLSVFDDTNRPLFNLSQVSMHSIAASLKTYLRKHEPLIQDELDFKDAFRVDKPEAIVTRYLSSLPLPLLKVVHELVYQYNSLKSMGIVSASTTFSLFNPARLEKFEMPEKAIEVLVLSLTMLQVNDEERRAKVAASPMLPAKFIGKLKRRASARRESISKLNKAEATRAESLGDGALKEVFLPILSDPSSGTLIRLIKYLNSVSLTTDGVYRKQGPRAEQNLLAQEIKRGSLTTPLEDFSPHSIALVIRSTLKEHHPLMKFDDLSGDPTSQFVIQTAIDKTAMKSKLHSEILYLILVGCSEMAANCEKTKMSARVLVNLVITSLISRSSTGDVDQDLSIKSQIGTRLLEGHTDFSFGFENKHVGPELAARGALVVEKVKIPTVQIAEPPINPEPTGPVKSKQEPPELRKMQSIAFGGELESVKEDHEEEESAEPVMRSDPSPLRPIAKMFSKANGDSDALSLETTESLSNTLPQAESRIASRIFRPVSHEPVEKSPEPSQTLMNYKVQDVVELYAVQRQFYNYIGPITCRSGNDYMTTTDGTEKTLLTAPYGGKELYDQVIAIKEKRNIPCITKADLWESLWIIFRSYCSTSTPREGDRGAFMNLESTKKFAEDCFLILQEVSSSFSSYISLSVKEIERHFIVVTSAQGRLLFSGFYNLLVRLSSLLDLSNAFSRNIHECSDADVSGERLRVLLSRFVFPNASRSFYSPELSTFNNSYNESLGFYTSSKLDLKPLVKLFRHYAQGGDSSVGSENELMFYDPNSCGHISKPGVIELLETLEVIPGLVSDESVRCVFDNVLESRKNLKYDSLMKENTVAEGNLCLPEFIKFITSVTVEALSSSKLFTKLYGTLNQKMAIAFEVWGIGDADVVEEIVAK